MLPISEAEQDAFERLPMEDRIAFTSVFDKYIAILKEEINDPIGLPNQVRK